MPYRAEDAESCLMWWFYRIWYVLCITCAFASGASGTGCAFTHCETRIWVDWNEEASSHR
jgi:hypothetical protein